MCQESTWVHTALQCDSKIGEGQRWLGAVIGYEGQRGLAPEAASEQSKENNCRFLHRKYIRDSSNLCVWLTGAKSPPVPPLFQHSPPLRQGSWCWESGKNTLKGNKASSGLILMAFAPATWYQTLPLIGQ